MVFFDVMLHIGTLAAVVFYFRTIYPPHRRPLQPRWRAGRPPLRTLSHNCHNPARAGVILKHTFERMFENPTECASVWSSPASSCSCRVVEKNTPGRQVSQGSHYRRARAGCRHRSRNIPLRLDLARVSSPASIARKPPASVSFSHSAFSAPPSSNSKLPAIPRPSCPSSSHGCRIHRRYRGAENPVPTVTQGKLIYFAVYC